MILLDTNVLSALMRKRPDRRVVEWLDDQPAQSIWTTSVTVFEVRAAIDLLDPGKRRRELEDAFHKLLGEDLEGRVQVLDQSAALAAGSMAALRQRGGNPVEVRDVQIAGIAKARHATLATGNTRHFVDLGIDLIDPWAS